MVKKELVGDARTCTVDFEGFDELGPSRDVRTVGDQVGVPEPVRLCTYHNSSDDSAAVGTLDLYGPG